MAIRPYPHRKTHIVGAAHKGCPYIKQRIAHAFFRV